MKFIFCADPFQTKQPDEMYQAEADAVRAIGLDCHIINFEALVYEKSAKKAVARIPVQDSEQPGLFRGWMMKPPQYEQLYQALADKGIRLINDPTAYTHCHYLPESYSVIEAKTPKSVWLPMSDFSLDRVMADLQPFGDRPMIVKDYVKSQKHYWTEACFIPSATNRAEVERVVNRFIELQDTDLNVGLVFREFVEFEALTQHSKSGMPLTKEFRLFVYEGQPFFATEYWEEGEYKDLQPPTEQFLGITQNVKSRFFTMDIAKQKNGDWLIVELGDGQVAGLPENVVVHDFYDTLSAQL